MEEKKETTAEEVEITVDSLDKAERCIERGDLDEAQKVLNAVEEKSGRKHYLQSRIYKAKFWYNEQRKQLKAAIKEEPDNEEYKKEYDELLEFKKTSEYKSTVKHPQMGDMEGCCLECFCVVCEGISFCN